MHRRYRIRMGSEKLVFVFAPALLEGLQINLDAVCWSGIPVVRLDRCLAHPVRPVPETRSLCRFVAPCGPCVPWYCGAANARCAWIWSRSSVTWRVYPALSHTVHTPPSEPSRRVPTWPDQSESHDEDCETCSLSSDRLRGAGAGTLGAGELAGPGSTRDPDPGWDAIHQVHTPSLSVPSTRPHTRPTTWDNKAQHNVTSLSLTTLLILPFPIHTTRLFTLYTPHLFLPPLAHAPTTRPRQSAPWPRSPCRRRSTTRSGPQTTGPVSTSSSASSRLDPSRTRMSRPSSRYVEVCRVGCTNRPLEPGSASASRARRTLPSPIVTIANLFVVHFAQPALRFAPCSPLTPSHKPGRTTSSRRR